MKIAALIPAVDEAETIRHVVAGIREHVSLVMVVDDGSRDDTAMLARDAGAAVLAHDRTKGKGTAIRTGLEHLLRRSELTHVLFLDGDLQHRPEEAPALITAGMDTAAHLVIGERQFDRGAMPASRYHANRLGSAALSGLVGVPLRDTQCGFRLCHTDMHRRLTLHATGYEIETEMLVKIGRLGGRIVQVPVTAVYENGRSKLRPVRDTTRTCFLAVYYRFLERI